LRHGSFYRALRYTPPMPISNGTTYYFVGGV
jgi:hypothetical protein